MNSQIEQAILRLGDAQFQELCDVFLYFQENPISFSSVGKVIAKVKSRKGIPDSFMVSSNGLFTFCEYTTLARSGNGRKFITKLRDSIDSCFNSTRTGISPKEIQKVILCHTSNLFPGELKSLIASVKAHNQNCEVEFYGMGDLTLAAIKSPLLQDMLGVNVGFDQLVSPSQFANGYQRNLYPIPLDNKLFARESEIESGVNLMKTSDLIILSGEPGVGKTKFALELCREHTLSNEGCEFYCVRDLGRPIWDEVKRLSFPGKKYVIFVDDANKILPNVLQLVEFLKSNTAGVIKVVATVRNIALTNVRAKLSEVKFEHIKINALSAHQIREIVTSSDFGIKNEIALDRIAMISKGNPRLAVMAAHAALQTNLVSSLANAENIYEHYFGPIFKNSILLRKQSCLDTIVILAFFGRLDFRNVKSIVQILPGISITPEEFKESCVKLDEIELVDLFEDRAAGISDQIFASYIFYKSVVKSNNPSVSIFIESFKTLGRKFNEAIFPIIEIFSYNNIRDELGGYFKEKWKRLSSEQDSKTCIEFLDYFWYFIPDETIAFIHKYISESRGNNADGREVDNFLTSFPSDENWDSEFHKDRVVNILCRFQNLETQYFKDSLHLLLEYARGQTDRVGVVIYAMQESFKIDRSSHLNQYSIQRSVVEFLVDSCKAKPDPVSLFVARHVVPSYLSTKIERQDVEGNFIKISTIRLTLHEAIERLRVLCWNFITSGAISKKNLRHILFDFPYRNYNESEDIRNFDKVYIDEIFSTTFDFAEVESCILYDKLYELHRSIKDIFPKVDYQSNGYTLFKLLDDSKGFSRASFNKRSWEKKKLTALTKYIRLKSYDVSQVLEDFRIVWKVIREYNIHWHYRPCLALLVLTCRRRKQAFFELLEAMLKFENGALGIDLGYIVAVYSGLWKNTLVDFLKVLDGIDEQLTLSVFVCYDLSKSTSEEVHAFYEHFFLFLREIKQPVSFHDWTKLAYFHNDKCTFYTEVGSLLVSAIEKREVAISIDAHFLEQCLSLPDFSFKIWESLYLNQRHLDHHFDYNFELMSKVLRENPTLLVKVLLKKRGDSVRLLLNQSDDFTILWQHDWFVLMVSAFLRHLRYFDKYKSHKESITGLFPEDLKSCDNRPIALFEEMIASSNTDSYILDVIFNAVIALYPNEQIRLLKSFLSLNTDFEQFKFLPLVSRSYSYTGYPIAAIEGKISRWGKILELLNSMTDRLKYLSHRQYVQSQIDAAISEKKDVLMSAFIEDGMVDVS